MFMSRETVDAYFGENLVWSGDDCRSNGCWEEHAVQDDRQLCRQTEPSTCAG